MSTNTAGGRSVAEAGGWTCRIAERGDISAFAGVGPPERAASERQFRGIGSNGGHELFGQNDVQIERDAFNGDMAANEMEQARRRAIREARVRGEFEDGANSGFCLDRQIGIRERRRRGTDQVRPWSW